MHLSSILAAIDSEISKLEKARTVIAELANSGLSSKAATRGAAPVTTRKDFPAPPKKRAPRKFSRAARKRMVEGQKKRWAAFRAAKAKKAATAKTR